MGEEEAQWELSKENILPMKTGRDVAALNAALGDQRSEWKEQRLCEWRAFQDKIVANEDHKEELLNTYYDLLCWLENTFPQGGKKYIKLNAKRCFHKLKDDTAFHQNWKFMKVLIKYIEADGQRCRYITEDQYGDLFNYMYINRIGTSHADFYISWANTLEANEAYPQASTVFNMGLKMGAEPRKTLEKEKTAFEDRMAIRAIEDMMKVEGEKKVSTAERRQPLQLQGSAARPKASAPRSEDSVVTLRKATSAVSNKNVHQNQQQAQNFAVHSKEPLQRPGVVGAAFTAVNAPPATNVVPDKHCADKENTQKPEQWAKPTKIPPKPSGLRLKPSSAKSKSDSTTFEVYCDEEEQNTSKAPICIGQPALRLRKDDDVAEGDDLLGGAKAAALETSKKGGKTSSETKIEHMFCDAVTSGPFGEMSFEELRANHFGTESERHLPPQSSASLQKNLVMPQNLTGGFLTKDDENALDHSEADLTMALNAEISRRGLSARDKQILGKTACADSMIGGEAEDSWSATINQPNPNETAESVRQSHDVSEADVSPHGSQNANTSNKLSATQFDCLNRILSEAFRGPSQASSVATPFGSNAEDSISSQVASARRAASTRPGGNADFDVFQDSTMNASAIQSYTKPDVPKPDFLAYEDTFVLNADGDSQPKKAIGLRPLKDDSARQPQPSFALFEDSFAKTPTDQPKPKQLGLQVAHASAESEPDFVLYDSFAAAPSAEQPNRSAKRGAIPRSAASIDPSEFVVINDGSASGTTPQSSSDSPAQKRTRPSLGGGLFSEGLTDCSDIVGDFSVYGDSSRLGLSATIDFNPNKPKFCSTQYVDYNMNGDQNQQECYAGDDGDPLLSHLPPKLRSFIPVPMNPGAKRQSITSRISTMPPLQERSESSSSGGSTMAMQSALQTVRESGLSAIWESNRSDMPFDQPPPPCIEDSAEVLEPEMEPLQKSYHTIDVQKYIAYSQLQQSVAFADKTYSCLREIDPTDPFSDELVERFLRRYGPSLNKLPNYVELTNTKLPEFFSGSVRQSGVGKIIHLAPNWSVTYSFNVGAGAFARVFAVREVESRKLYALKFQKPACKWEFYIVHELRERLKRKVNLQCILDAVLNIEQAFIYDNGSCYVMQHVRYGPLLNLVNQARGHKADLSEAVAAYLTIELLRIFESIHKCHIIHADMKPDNVLFLGLPALPKLTRSMSGEQLVFPPKQASIRLIDYGRSIDMTMFPPDTAFLAKVATSGFDCIEMRTDRPWTYQADFFGLAGTVHVLVFLEYMRVSWRDDPERDGSWWINRKFKRWWHHNDLWERLFLELLNIPDCDHQPDVKSLREAFEQRFCEKMLTPYASSQSSIMRTMNEEYHERP